jgi:hypothetical protein
MTLSGVIKDILLVCASMLIFRDPVSRLQAFGYFVALCGLIYYKLGAEKIREYVGAIQRSWADFGLQRPILRRLTVIGMVFMLVLLVLGGISSSGAVSPKYDPMHHANSWLNKLLGWGNEGWTGWRTGKST